MIFIELYVFIDRIEFDIYGIENQQKQGMIQDTIILPRSFNIGSKLEYIRKTIHTLINQYNVRNAHLYIENNRDIIDMIKMEGVIEELFSNSGVEIWK